MIYGMAGVGDEAGCGVGMVRYHTAVRLPLLDFPSGAKRQIWRDRQIQAQAYNWGVADALRVHYRGELIPSPRNHSAPLTRLRHKTGSVHSLLLQRGGCWSAVDAVKKWSRHRNQLVYAQRKAVEGTDKALNTLATFAAKKPAHSAVLVQARAMSASVTQYRNAQRRRVELVESGDGNALRLRATPPDRGLVEMSADERAVMIAAAVERSNKALEAFSAALKTLRAKIRIVDSTEAARKRLRALAEKIHKAVAAEAKADKRLLAHIAKGDERLFRDSGAYVLVSVVGASRYQIRRAVSAGRDSEANSPVVVTSEFGYQIRPQNTPTRRPHPDNLTSRNHNKNTQNTNIHATASNPYPGHPCVCGER